MCHLLDNRFPGTSGDNAVSSGSAIQPAQPGDSNRVDDSHLSPAGDAQNAGRVAATEAGSASEKNLIAFDLFQESAGLKGMNIDTIGSRHSSLLAIMSAGAGAGAVLQRREPHRSRQRGTIARAIEGKGKHWR